MKKILITGAGGFIGKNAVAELGQSPEEYELLCVDIDTPQPEFDDYIRRCDFVVHLAGVNRPKTEDEFSAGNAGLTEWLLAALEQSGNIVPVLMTSSIQSDLDNAYGKSKRAAELAVIDYGRRNAVPVYVFKLPNVFGKWCRPNYNSAVATFCYNIANELPITVTDPERMMTLIYIDDVLALIKRALAGELTPESNGYSAVDVTYECKLGDIAEKIKGFHAIKTSLLLPDLETGLDKALYSTYLSYLAPGDFAYALVSHADDRGLFAEFFKTHANGQFSVSTTKPGITRGNHWHHTKVEKFFVVAGRASIKFRDINGGDVIEYVVSADEPKIVDIPPGYTHNITNIDERETLVTVIWANELFDPARPDTYFLEV